MAKTTYKLYDPSSNQYVQFGDGSTVKTTDAPRSQIEQYAKDKGFKVNYVEGGAQFALPQLSTELPGLTTAEQPLPPPPTVQISPLEKAAADVNPLEAAAGGLLSGLTLDWREEIFGSDKDEVKPAAAEQKAYPKIFGGSKLVGETATNILADLGILALSGGKIKSPAALAAIGGGLTSGVQALGEREQPISEMTSEDVLETGGEMIGGAAGGAIGAKILGPVLGKVGRYVESKIPKLGGPKFPTRAGAEAVESRMEKLAAGAEEEMVKKPVLEEMLPSIEQKAQVSRLRTKALEAAQKEMLDEAKITKEGLERIKPTEAELAEFNRIKQKSKAASKEYKKIGFEQPLSTSNKLTKEEIATFDIIKKKIADYKQAEEQFGKEAEGRAMELFGEYPGNIIPETVKKPKFTPKEIKQILSKATEDLTPDELFVAIERHEPKRKFAEEELKKLTDAITQLDTSINTKKTLFDTLEKRLNTFQGPWKARVAQYLTDMKYKALGGAVGQEAGVAGEEYMTGKSGQKDYTAEALNSLLMPK